VTGEKAYLLALHVFLEATVHKVAAQAWFVADKELNRELKALPQRAWKNDWCE
jgi:hypothetical protein